MGFLGWTGWLSAEIDKYKLLRDSAKDAKEIEAYDKIIADLEAKQSESAE